VVSHHDTSMLTQRQHINGMHATSILVATGSQSLNKWGKKTAR
jgi:hypothetical protein